MTIGAVLALVAGYLIGAIPTGLLIGKWTRGIDLREHGSRNIGFTNAVRVLGWKIGSPVLLIDVGKGIAAVLLLPHLAGEPSAVLPVLVGAAVLAGNLANVFLRFRGGKGVATGLGVFLALVPVPTLIALAVFGVLLAITRFVSFSSLVAGVVLTLATLVLVGAGSAFVFAALTTIAVFVKHRGNIRRLISGTEPRIGARTPSPPA